VIKAFLIPREGFEPGEALIAEIQGFVKTRLAAYEYPRHIEFVSDLPLTTTGKVRRTELRMRRLTLRDSGTGGVDPSNPAPSD